jgi:hypothetical protein
MEILKVTRLEDELPAGRESRPGAAIDSSPLHGTWHNTDKQTRGIVKLIISAGGGEGSLSVRAFGACEPSPCDWGETQGRAYSGGVSSDEGMAFTVTFDFEFMETSLAVYMKGGILVLDSFNTFKDDSGRFNYFSREFFHS